MFWLCALGGHSHLSRRGSVLALVPQHGDVVPQQPIICQNYQGWLQVPHRGRKSLPAFTYQVTSLSNSKGDSTAHVIIMCVCVCFHREIELPLHDNGMEPLEFLKSMGISLMPLNEAARSTIQKVSESLLFMI